MVRIIIEIEGGEAVVRGGADQELTGAAAPTSAAAALTAVPAIPSAAYGTATNAGRAPLGPSSPGAMSISGAQGPLPFTEMATTLPGTGEESAGAAPEALGGGGA